MHNSHPPEKNPYTIANRTAPGVFVAPNMAKTNALVMTITGQMTLNGPKMSARELSVVRPNVEAALRIASYVAVGTISASKNGR